MQLKASETTRKKARTRAASLGHDLVNFRKSRTNPNQEIAYCRHCFKYAFVEEDDIRGGAVTDYCHISNKG